MLKLVKWAFALALALILLLGRINVKYSSGITMIFLQSGLKCFILLCKTCC